MGPKAPGLFGVLVPALLMVCLMAAGSNGQSPTAAPPQGQVQDKHNALPAADDSQPAALLPPLPTAAGLPPADPGAPRYTLMPDVVLPSQGPDMPAGDGLAPPGDAPSRFHLEASWEHGLRMYSDDNQFHLHVGGNAQIDSTWLIAPKEAFFIPGGATNGVENAAATMLRRARFRMEGDIYDQFDFIVEYEFAHAENENSGLQPNSFGNLSTSPVPCNIWMQVRDVPVLGNVRFGNQVKPIGMTNNTYQGFLPFMERADNQDAFYAPFDSGFALGLSARNWTQSQRLTWQYGIYRPSIDTAGVSLNKYSFGGRVTALPWYEDDGERLVHLGLGYWSGEIVQDELQVRARPELRNAPGYAVPILVNTGDIPGSRQYTVGPEFALVRGPWTVQAEWAGQWLTDAVASNGKLQGTVFYEGGYVELLYFLTGEHQEYVKTEGVFGRVVPRNNYHVKKDDDNWSCGAWQLGVRFSYLDLIDKAILGGQVYDWTLGLNWFLNPNMKVQFNYIVEHREAPQNVTDSWINGFGIRGAYDF
jgi:phosphate-selective porin OprO/OprP